MLANILAAKVAAYSAAGAIIVFMTKQNISKNKKLKDKKLARQCLSCCRSCPFVRVQQPGNVLGAGRPFCKAGN